ncbi:MAG: hypothetical protein ABFC57_12725 [Veillonellales bacterium]
MAMPEKKVATLNDLPAEKQLELLKRQSISFLGDGQVFVKKTADGFVRAVKAPVVLEESNSELAVIQGKTMVTAKGFYHANQIAGLSIITPEKLTLPDGQVVVNPYPIVDPDSGLLRKVWVKKMAIGNSPTGVLVVTSATLLYDINMYFIQDLVKKVQYNASAGRICMENTLTDDERKKGIFYKIDGAMGVWADMTNKDVLKAVDTFVNKKQFAERNAQTIAERVALQKHPAMAHIAYVEPVGSEKHHQAKVIIYGFVPDFSQKQLLDIADQAERGEEIVINGQKAEVIETVGTASDVDMTVDVDDEEKEAQAEPSHGPVKTDLFGGEKY